MLQIAMLGFPPTKSAFGIACSATSSTSTPCHDDDGGEDLIDDYGDGNGEVFMTSYIGRPADTDMTPATEA